MKLNQLHEAKYATPKLELDDFQRGDKIIITTRSLRGTERRIAEQKLKESEEKYRLISENANDLILVLNQKFECEFINEQASKKIWGYDYADLNGKSVISFDGIAGFMTLGSDVTLTDEYSIFVVLNTDDVASDRMILGDDGTSIKTGISDTGELFVRVLGGGSNDMTQTFASGNSILYITRDSSDKVDQAFDGADLNRLFSDVAQTGTTTYRRIGTDNAGFFWDGDVAKIIIYDRALTPLEIDDINKELALDYGLVLS